MPADEPVRECRAAALRSREVDFAFGAHRLHQATLEHVGRRSFGRGVGQLADQPARFRNGLRAFRATGGQMSFERGAFRRVQRAKRVGFVHLPELVAVAHVAACNPSLSRIKPFRIQLFTVPSGSFKFRGNLGMAQALEIGQLDGAFLLRIQLAHQRAHALCAPLFVQLFLILRSDHHGI